jgi:hypothetical protein
MIITMRKLWLPVMDVAGPSFLIVYWGTKKAVKALGSNQKQILLSLVQNCLNSKLVHLKEATVHLWKLKMQLLWKVL